MPKSLNRILHIIGMIVRWLSTGNHEFNAWVFLLPYKNKKKEKNWRFHGQIQVCVWRHSKPFHPVQQMIAKDLLRFHKSQIIYGFMVLLFTYFFSFLFPEDIILNTNVRFFFSFFFSMGTKATNYQCRLICINKLGMLKGLIPWKGCGMFPCSPNQIYVS